VQRVAVDDPDLRGAPGAIFERGLTAIFERGLAAIIERGLAARVAATLRAPPLSPTFSAPPPLRRGRRRGRGPGRCRVRLVRGEGHGVSN